jgi:hypothetical protein
LCFFALFVFFLCYNLLSASDTEIFKDGGDVVKEFRDFTDYISDEKVMAKIISDAMGSAKTVKIEIVVMLVILLLEKYHEWANTPG